MWMKQKNDDRVYRHTDDQKYNGDLAYSGDDYEYEMIMDSAKKYARKQFNTLIRLVWQWGGDGQFILMWHLSTMVGKIKDNIIQLLNECRK